MRFLPVHPLKTIVIQPSLDHPDPNYRACLKFWGEYTDVELWVELARKKVTPEAVPTVLDLGCGIGLLAIPLARAGCRVHAVDADPYMVEELRERQAAGVTPHLAKIEELRLNETFDLVMLTSALLNCVGGEDRAAFLLSAVRHMNAGSLFVAEVFREDWLRDVHEFRNEHQHLRGEISDAGEKVYLLTYEYFFPDLTYVVNEVPTHLLSRDKLEREARSVGLSFAGEPVPRTPITDLVFFHRTARSVCQPAM